MSEDEKRDETEVEAHNRRLARNDEPADESRRAEGDEDEVEAHMRRVATPRRVQ